MTLSRKRLVVAALALPVGLILGSLIAVLTPAASSTTASPAAHRVVSSTDPTSTTTPSTLATTQPTVNPAPATGAGLGCDAHARHPAHQDRLASTTTTTTNPDSPPATERCPLADSADALDAGRPARGDSDSLGP